MFSRHSIVFEGEGPLNLLWTQTNELYLKLFFIFRLRKRDLLWTQTASLDVLGPLWAQKIVKGIIDEQRPPRRRCVPGSLDDAGATGA